MFYIHSPVIGSSGFMNTIWNENSFQVLYFCFRPEDYTIIEVAQADEETTTVSKTHGGFLFMLPLILNNLVSLLCS